VIINLEGIITVYFAAQRTSQAVCYKNLGLASALQSKHSGEIRILRCTVQHPLWPSQNEWLCLLALACFHRIRRAFERWMRVNNRRAHDALNELGDCRLSLVAE
jgi:hypothetical protein